MNKCEVSFLTPNRIALTTLLPYMEQFEKSGTLTHVIAPSGVIDIIKKKITATNFKFHSLEPLIRRRRLQSILHKSLLLLFTPCNFSVHWQEKVDSLSKTSHPVKGFVIKILQTVPLKLRRGNINKTIHQILTPFFKNPFPTVVVITTTIKGCGYLLTSRGIKTIAILESWDQPSKYPSGYFPQRVFVWNGKLKNDWINYQDSGSVNVGFPTKLHYIIKKAHESAHIRRRIPPTIMYPSSYCLNSKIFLHQEECRLIRVFAEITQKLGVNLIIKPKPNGTQGEYKKALQGFSHVRVGTYQNYRAEADYFLSDAYNRQRIHELQDADLVINFGTTFAIDAALFGLPILQLEPLKGGSFPELVKAKRNFHLQKYILKNKDFVYGFLNDGDIEKAIKKGLAEYTEEPFIGKGSIWKMKDELHSFVKPEKTLEEAIDLVKSCCKA